MSRMGELAVIESQRTDEMERLAPDLYQSLKEAIAFIEMRLAFDEAGVGRSGEHVAAALQRIRSETGRISISRGLDYEAEIDLAKARSLIESVDQFRRK